MRAPTAARGSRAVGTRHRKCNYRRIKRGRRCDRSSPFPSFEAKRNGRKDGTEESSERGGRLKYAAWRAGEARETEEGAGKEDRARREASRIGDARRDCTPSLEFRCLFRCCCCSSGAPSLRPEEPLSGRRNRRYLITNFAELTSTAL